MFSTVWPNDSGLIMKGRKGTAPPLTSSSHTSVNRVESCLSSVGWVRRRRIWDIAGDQSNLLRSPWRWILAYSLKLPRPSAVQGSSIISRPLEMTKSIQQASEVWRTSFGRTRSLSSTFCRTLLTRAFFALISIPSGPYLFQSGQWWYLFVRWKETNMNSITGTRLDSPAKAFPSFSQFNFPFGAPTLPPMKCSALMRKSSVSKAFASTLSCRALIAPISDCIINIFESRTASDGALTIRRQGGSVVIIEV